MHENANTRIGCFNGKRVIDFPNPRDQQGKTIDPLTQTNGESRFRSDGVMSRGTNLGRTLNLCSLSRMED